MINFFLGLSIGVALGIFIAALMRANDKVEPCPECKSVGFINTAPGQWETCSLCKANGLIRKSY